MAHEEDKELADAVRSARRDLNDAVFDAVKAGLTVNMSVLEKGRLTSVEQPVCNVEIYRSV